MRIVDLTNLRFGRLVALHRIARIDAHARWLCRCDCGRETAVRGASLTRGDTTSCGCYRKEFLIGNKYGITHGGNKTREHKAWIEMKTRCLNREDTGFANYGGRGIRIHRRWLGKNGFAHFRSDMGPCPPECTLDRIDNNGHYTPKNCRWATRKQQQRNTRATVRITIDGKTQALSDWTEQLGVVSHNTALSRIIRGWDAVLAVTTPPATSWYRQRHAGKVG